MEVGGVLVSVLFAAFSLPCLLLLLVLAEAGLRLAALAVRGDGGGGGRYAWPTRSAFLGYRIARAGAAGGRLSSASAAGGFPQDEAPLPRECCDRLAVALYRRGKGPDQPEAPVDCVFCLSRVDEGEEVRELRCRHVFHRACLDRWAEHGQRTCPLCRTPLFPPPSAAASPLLLPLPLPAS